MVKILGREEVDRIMVGRIYVAVVQAVLLFGSETWVTTPWFEKALEGLHYQALRWMTGTVLKHNNIEHRSNHSVERLGQRFGWMRSGCITPDAIKKLYNKLQLILSWICFWRQSIIQD